jgi:Bacterial regulatory proteins, tetR family
MGMVRASVVDKFRDRRRKAAATRQRIIGGGLPGVLHDGLCRDDDAVADEAGVAKQTVYFIFHSKPELLSAVTEDYAAGEPDAPPVADRSWHREAATSDDARRSLG